MAVSRVDVEPAQTGKGLERVGQRLVHGDDKLPVGLGAQGQTACALQGREKVVYTGQRQTRLHGLEKIPAAFDFLEHACNADVEPVFVRQFGAGTTVGELRKQARDGGEKPGINSSL